MNSSKSAVEAYYAYQTRARGLLDKNSLNKRFSKQARWYQQRLNKYLPENRNAAILDIPCGYGNILFFLRSQSYNNVIGYDLDPNQIELARLLDLPAFEGDAFAVVGDHDRLYDCILSVDFLEHLSRDQTLHFLQLCATRLNPGGVLIVRTPCADGLFGAHDRYNDLTHQWAMTSNVLNTLLQMIGFRNSVILDERPQPYNVVNCLRLLAFYPMLWLSSVWLMALGLDLPKVWSRSMWAVGTRE